MSDLPPNIDAILASIRSRMNDDPVVPVPAPVLMAIPDVAVADLGTLEVVPAVVPAGGPMTLEGLMRTLLEPMLKAWLDAHMPEIVEKLALAEIKRLTGQP